MDHEWKLDGVGERLQYRCTRCGAIEHAFRERTGPDGFRVRPATIPNSCEEETVRFVLEE